MDVWKIVVESRVCVNECFSGNYNRVFWNDKRTRRPVEVESRDLHAVHAVVSIFGIEIKEVSIRIYQFIIQILLTYYLFEYLFVVFICHK